MNEPKGRALSPEQKDAILGIIGEAWKAAPEMRLGQLVDVVCRQVYAPGMEGFSAAAFASNGLFHAEDMDLAYAIWLHTSKQLTRLLGEVHPDSGKDEQRDGDSEDQP